MKNKTAKIKIKIKIYDLIGIKKYKYLVYGVKVYTSGTKESNKDFCRR
jgi:hypothetical protein